MNKIHIIIPVFNGWQQTEICLNALRASICRNLEIIVVDHGSTDETKEALPTQYPEVVHILGEPTLWWTGATNLGIREAIHRGAESIMLLNNDCYVDSETIEKLIAHSRRAGEAIIAPVQRDFLTKRILCVKAITCYLLGFSTIIPRKTHKGIGKQMLLPTKLIIGGRGVLIPKSVLQRVGMFDEVNLPHYGSDNDFYLRCRNVGIPLFIAADSTVYIDNRTTTIASNLGNMSLPQFLESLRDRRSHRNIRDLSALFKLHYPIKGLYQLGVALNLFRYFTLYGWKRLRHTLS
jgi:GT2 family glycosyltransferase